MSLLNNIDKPCASFKMSGNICNVDIPAENNGPLLFLEAISDNNMIILGCINIVKMEMDESRYFRYSGFISKMDATRLCQYINNNL